jgi:hypothetical protein
MPEAMKDVQHPWNCRWVRPACQFVGIPELEQPHGQWVCVRPRRGRLTVNCVPPHVTEEECAGCEFFWEADPLARPRPG